MAPTPKRSKKQILEAIPGSGGIRAEVMRRLGIKAYSTLRAYLAKYPEAKEALENEEEKALDDAESKLIEAVNAGNLGAIMYFLNNKGRKRGYGKWGENAARQKDGVAGVLVVPALLDDARWEAAAQPGKISANNVSSIEK